MVLALEEGYDRPSWWHSGRFRAETHSEQEVQPIFTIKDGFDLCTCEGGEAQLPGYGQIDEETGGELTEYVWCPLGGLNPQMASPQYRYDWRPGRELNEEQASRWALYHNSTDAHFLFNGPRKEETSSATLPASGGIIPTDLADYVSAAVDLRLTDWQRALLDALPRGSIDLNSAADTARRLYGDPERVIVTYQSDDDVYGWDGGVLTAQRGSSYVRVAVSRELMEDPIASDIAVRKAIDELNRHFDDGGGREGSGTDRGGSSEA